MRKRPAATLNFSQRASIVTQLYQEGLADDEQARQLMVIATDRELVEMATQLEYDFGV